MEELPASPVQMQHLACVVWLLNWLFFHVHFHGGALHAAGLLCAALIRLLLCRAVVGQWWVVACLELGQEPCGTVLWVHHPGRA